MEGNCYRSIRKKKKVPIELSMWIDRDGVYGLGSDTVGDFVIKGRVDALKVMFVKSYHIRHEVKFLGYLETINGVRYLQGFWGLDNIEGLFSLSSEDASKSRENGAIDIMIKMQELAISGPFSESDKTKISQCRLGGYTGPQLDPKDYTTIEDGWIIHPGKAKWDHHLQSGQGSLKGHIHNLNLPSHPAWNDPDRQDDTVYASNDKNGDYNFSPKNIRNISLFPFKKEQNVDRPANFLGHAEITSTYNGEQLGSDLRLLYGDHPSGNSNSYLKERYGEGKEPSSTYYPLEEAYHSYVSNYVQPDSLMDGRNQSNYRSN